MRLFPVTVQTVWKLLLNRKRKLQVATLEAFNWSSSAYEIVDASAESFNTDTVVSVDLSSGISNCVQTGSGAVRSRIGWRQTGFIINFPWEARLDQMVWKAN